MEKACFFLAFVPPREKGTERGLGNTQKAFGGKPLARKRKTSFAERLIGKGENAFCKKEKNRKKPFKSD